MKSASISLLSLDARASWQGSTSQSQSIRVSRVPSGHPTVPSSFAPLLGAKNKARVDQGGGQEAALQARSRCEGSPLYLSTESTRAQPTFAMLQSRLDSFHAACHLTNRSAINLAGGFPRKELSSSCFVGGAASRLAIRSVTCLQRRSVTALISSRSAIGRALAASSRMISDWISE
jgi:hypothetical protein